MQKVNIKEDCVEFTVFASMIAGGFRLFVPFFLVVGLMMAVVFFCLRYHFIFFGEMGKFILISVGQMLNYVDS